MPVLNNSSNASRRVIIVADDFGRSESVNRAVIEAHRDGVLTCASLMVGECAWREAVQFAKESPELGVGLHLTLACGRSVLPAEQIPYLANPNGEMDSSPIKAGLRYFFNRQAKAELECEIEAQFEKFRSTGLRLDHVNGHLNMHLHPVVMPQVLRHARAAGCAAVRLTRDPLMLNLRLASGRLAYRVLHWLIFQGLSAFARGDIDAAGFRYTHRVVGLLQSGNMNPDFVASLLRCLHEGDSEIYFHPDTVEGKNNVDLKSLVNPAVRQFIESCGIQLIRYQDL